MKAHGKTSPLVVRLSGNICLLLVLFSATLTSGRAQITGAGPEPLPYDTPPVLIHQEQGRYTADARQAGKSGTVTVMLTVTLNGLASHVHVVRGLGIGLDEAALEAVRKDRFKPAMKDGKAVLATIKLDVPFDPAVNP